VIVVAVHPQDVVEAGISLSQKLAVCATLIDTVAAQHAEPAAGFGRVKDYKEAIFGRKLQNAVGAHKVVLIRLGNIVIGHGPVAAGRIDGGVVAQSRERNYTIEGFSVGAACRTAGAQQIDPYGVKAVSA